MPLSVGERLGPYEILAPIGVGGMGEVYRAVDTRLHRDVAVKVSAERFTERFEREARVIASLNHPNISTLFDVGPNYLVMELIEGSTLTERIALGAIPLEESLNIAKQIADALEAAHEKGIVHRDLKPGNIKIAPDGTVKVLDFGLAKISGTSTAKTEDSPTISMAATQAGMILGTAAYMSPEQARGKVVDKRADIWAFGVVLYEMLTGKRPFHGDDVTDTLAAVLRQEPEWEQVPLKARRLLRKCLEKDPKRRLRDIGDAGELLEDAPVVSAPSPGTLKRLRLRFGWAVAAVLGMVAVVVGGLHFRETLPAGQPMHLSISLPEDAGVRSLALSPDGRNLVLAAVIGSQYHLWIRGINSTELRPLPGTDLARTPFWSPDGRFIGFFADGKLKTISATGGPATVLCDAVSPSGGTWNRDGVILFTPRVSPYRVAQTGGACTPVTKIDAGGFQRFPEFLPDGRHFFYVQQGTTSAQGVYVASLDDPNGRRVLADDSSVAYLPPAAENKLGYLLFIRESTLMAQPFDPAALQPVGDVVTIARQASFSNSPPQMAASLAANGVLAYVANGETTGARLQISWVDRLGKEIEKVGAAGVFRSLSLSPDDKILAYTRPEPGSGTVWLRDLIRGSDSRFSSQSFTAVWSPQVNRIVFGGVRQGSVANDLYLKDIGSSQEELLLQNGNTKSPSDWSQDGRYVVYTEVDPKTRGDIWYLQDPLSKTERKAVRFQATPFNESQGQISPDGHLIAYTSIESGQDEVYVRPFPTGDGKWPVSTKGGQEPRWRRDGKELFYLEGLSPRFRMMAVAVTRRARPSFGSPQPLFDVRLGNALVTEFNGFAYSPSADGKRFLVNTFPTDVRPTLDVLLNWQKAMGAEGR